MLLLLNPVFLITGKRQHVMRTFQGHNPNTMKVHSRKSQPSKKKPREFYDTVEVHIIDDDSDGDANIHKDYSMEDTSKHLVMYNPEITYDKQGEVEVTEPIDNYTSLNQRYMKPRHGYNTVLPSIGAYTVQCAHCFKWRIIPTKEKYEEIRENICQDVFVCERAREWNRVISCVDPEDISQDGSRVWAIDKASISQTPPGWDREVRIRGEGCSKFADVYVTVSFPGFAVVRDIWYHIFGRFHIRISNFFLYVPNSIFMLIVAHWSCLFMP